MNKAVDKGLIRLNIKPIFVSHQCRRRKRSKAFHFYTWNGWNTMKHAYYQNVPFLIKAQERVALQRSKAFHFYTWNGWNTLKHVHYQNVPFLIKEQQRVAPQRSKAFHFYTWNGWNTLKHVHYQNVPFLIKAQGRAAPQAFNSVPFLHVERVGHYETRSLSECSVFNKSAGTGKIVLNAILETKSPGIIVRS